jgi:hypothetical protein
MYGDRIYPDELVDNVQKFTVIMDEDVPQPAIDRLCSQAVVSCKLPSAGAFSLPS